MKKQKFKSSQNVQGIKYASLPKQISGHKISYSRHHGTGMQSIQYWETGDAAPQRAHVLTQSRMQACIPTCRPLKRETVIQMEGDWLFIRKKSLHYIINKFLWGFNPTEKYQLWNEIQNASLWSQSRDQQIAQRKDTKAPEGSTTSSKNTPNQGPGFSLWRTRTPLTFHIQSTAGPLLNEDEVMTMT